jgi:hypothetical protein
MPAADKGWESFFDGAALSVERRIYIQFPAESYRCYTVRTPSKSRRVFSATKFICQMPRARDNTRLKKKESHLG